MPASRTVDIRGRFKLVRSPNRPRPLRAATVVEPGGESDGVFLDPLESVGVLAVEGAAPGDRTTDHSIEAANGAVARTEGIQGATVQSIEDALADGKIDADRIVEDVLGVLEWKYEATVDGRVSQLIPVVSFGGPSCQVVVTDGVVHVEAQSGAEHASGLLFADHFAELVGKV